jgi:hypothetical protein
MGVINGKDNAHFRPDKGAIMTDPRTPASGPADGPQPAALPYETVWVLANESTGEIRGVYESLDAIMKGEAVTSHTKTGGLFATPRWYKVMIDDTWYVATEYPIKARPAPF